MQQWQVGPVPDWYPSPNAQQPNHPSDIQQQHAPHYPQPDMARRQQEQGHFAPYGAPPAAQPGQPQHHQAPVQPAMPHAQQGQATAPPQQQQSTPTPAPAPTPRQRKRPAPSQQAAHPPAAHTPQHAQQQHPQQHQQQVQQHPQHAQQQHPQHLQQQQQQHQAVPPTAQPHQGPAVAAPPPVIQTPIQPPTAGALAAPVPAAAPAPAAPADDSSGGNPPPAKKSRTNTPWSPAEELRLKQMRDAGNSWAEIAKTFPTRTEGSVKKHWYKDMHYAEFAEDESQALLNAIKEYENNKWKTIGQKVGKPAKACEQYAKEHFPDLFSTPKPR